MKIMNTGSYLSGCLLCFSDGIQSSLQPFFLLSHTKNKMKKYSDHLWLGRYDSEEAFEHSTFPQKRTMPLSARIRLLRTRRNSIEKQRKNRSPIPLFANQFPTLRAIQIFPRATRQHGNHPKHHVQIKHRQSEYLYLADRRQTVSWIRQQIWQL